MILAPAVVARNIKNAVVLDAFYQFGAYMIDSELINEKEIIEECLIYQSTMNNVVGIILFTIGVSCIVYRDSIHLTVPLNGS